MLLYYSIFLPLCISLCIGMYIIPRILLVSARKQLFDEPDDRKVHERPVSRLGGISFLPILLISVCTTMALRMIFDKGFMGFGDQERILLIRMVLLLLGMMVMYLVGVKDDIVGVAYRWKFVAQIFAGLLLPIGGVWVYNLDGLFGFHELPVWAGWLLTVVVVVYITNAINLIDGIDGLASGLAMIAFVFFGLCFAWKGEYLMTTLSFGMIGVLIPFWMRNVFGNEKRGRKIFMGDTGSLTLGYLLSFLVISLSMQGGTMYPEGMLMVCMGPLVIPLLDVAYVVYIRIKNGKNPFKPDKNHIHHRLLRTGIGPHCVLVVLLAASLLFMALNMAGVWAGMSLTLILCVDVGLWLLMQLVIFICQKRC